MDAWTRLWISVSVLVLPTLSQANLGFVPVKNASTLVAASPADAAKPPTLLYYGGPVISHVKIHLVFWGEIYPDTQKKMPAFFNSLVGSNFMDWLDQYSTYGTPVQGGAGTNQHIGKGSYAGATVIKPFNHGSYIDDTEIQQELKQQFAAGALPKPDDDTLYMIYFPPNFKISAFGSTSCVNFCAYHSSSGTPNQDHFFYGVMPDIHQTGCDMGCAYGPDDFRSLTAISSHEYTEAITDPFPAPGSHVVYPQAWNDVEGNEIGDLCAGGNDELKTPHDTYTVQSEWDNSKNGCSSQKWTSGQ